MAKCKLCKKLIADGTEFCDECAEKKDLVSNESYLDELLNSVQSKTTTASDIYKKKKEDQSDNSPNIIAPQENDESSFIDQNDLDEFNDYDFMTEFEDPIEISHEELYGDSVALPEDSNEEQTKDIEHEEDPDNIIYQLDANIDNEFLEMSGSDEQGSIEDEPLEPVLDDLLKHLDMVEENDESADNKDSDDSDDSADIDVSFDDIDDLADIADIDSLVNNNNSVKDENSAENELLDLLNHFNPDAQGEDEIQAISDLLGGIDNNNQLSKEYPEDIGEVFSEALEAVSDLSDSNQGIQYITPDSDFDDKKDTKGKKDKKENKDKKEKKQGLFAKLFANIDDEEISPEKKKIQDEKILAKKDMKRNKKKLGKKDSVDANAEGDDLAAEDKQEAVLSKKKTKKEKKKKIEILDDYVDEGRINKAGASVVFLFFGILVMLLLISTNIFSYSLSIKNATDYFGRQKYTQAYNEVYGIELKDEDIQLYDKIMTVMFVNKQLNSYNSYYHMRKFPEALDSLLKGLERYDKYIELATMLGIKTDFDYVRNQIIAELYNVFSLTEEDALNIINSESQSKYSIAVYDVILENISFYN